jgi:hypothetical protein
MKHDHGLSRTEHDNQRRRACCDDRASPPAIQYPALTPKSIDSAAPVIGAAPGWQR